MSPSAERKLLRAVFAALKPFVGKQPDDALLAEMSLAVQDALAPFVKVNRELGRVRPRVILLPCGRITVRFDEVGLLN